MPQFGQNQHNFASLLAPNVISYPSFMISILMAWDLLIYKGIIKLNHVN